MQGRSQKLVSDTEIISEESSEFYRMNEFIRIFLGQLMLILSLDLNELCGNPKIISSRTRQFTFSVHLRFALFLCHSPMIALRLRAVFFPLFGSCNLFIFRHIVDSFPSVSAFCMV